MKSDLSPVESKKKIEELTAELEQSKTESSVVSEKLQSAEALVQVSKDIEVISKITYVSEKSQLKYKRPKLIGRFAF